jgi:hypothetical protein
MPRPRRHILPGIRTKWLEGSHVRMDDRSLTASEIPQAVKQRQAR